MGNQNTNTQISETFPQTKFNWFFADPQNPKIVVSGQQKPRVAQLFIMQSHKNVIQDIEIYGFRHRNSQYLVNIEDVLLSGKRVLPYSPSIETPHTPSSNKSFQLQKQIKKTTPTPIHERLLSSLCSQHSTAPPLSLTSSLPNNNSQYSLMLQYIPYRLSDLGIISFDEMIYILQFCIEGLHCIWIEYGKIVCLDEEMICFNADGKCKIWLNAILWENQFYCILEEGTEQNDNGKSQKNHQQQNNSFSSYPCPLTVIQSLFELLENRVCQQELPESYLRQKENIWMNKFSDVKNFIKRTKKQFYIKTDSIVQAKVDVKEQFLSHKTPNTYNSHRAPLKTQEVNIKVKSKPYEKLSLSKKTTAPEHRQPQLSNLNLSTAMTSTETSNSSTNQVRPSKNISAQGVPLLKFHSSQ